MTNIQNDRKIQYDKAKYYLSYCKQLSTTYAQAISPESHLEKLLNLVSDCSHTLKKYLQIAKTDDGLLKKINEGLSSISSGTLDLGWLTSLDSSAPGLVGSVAPGFLTKSVIAKAESFIP
jgi:hypothetical protein